MRGDSVPDVRYARSGGVAVAYQAVGEGPRELVFVPFLSSLVSLWELPAMRMVFDRLAAETRLTVLNPRGMGLSDCPRSLCGTIDSRRARLRLPSFGACKSAPTSLMCLDR